MRTLVQSTTLLTSFVLHVRLKSADMANSIKKLRPLFDRVIVEKLLPETITKGGVLLPVKGMGKVLEGTVIAAGPGGRDQHGNVIPISVQEGDKVLLPEYGGTKINLDEKEYHIFRDAEILGIFSE